MWEQICSHIYLASGVLTLLTCSHGQVKDFSVLVLDNIKGYRILFDWYPTSDSVEPVELRLFIRTQDRTLSETWLYQYFPPAPEQIRSSSPWPSPLVWRVQWRQIALRPPRSSSACNGQYGSRNSSRARKMISAWQVRKMCSA